MKHSNTFKIAAAIILALTAVYWLYQGISWMLRGVTSEIRSLILAIIMFCLILFSWKRPLLGGIITASIGVLLSIYFLVFLPDLQTAIPPLLLMCTPTVISGLLFIEADWSSKKRN
jgi:hypothetical protein